MSEFGDFDVDGVLIHDSRIQVAKLVEGCACCDLL
jgi:G3E family GTPase